MGTVHGSLNVSDLAVPGAWVGFRLAVSLGRRSEEVARPDKSNTMTATSLERFHGLVNKGASKQGLICP